VRCRVGLGESLQDRSLPLVHLQWRSRWTHGPCCHKRHLFTRHYTSALPRKLFHRVNAHHQIMPLLAGSGLKLSTENPAAPFSGNMSVRLLTFTTLLPESRAAFLFLLEHQRIDTRPRNRAPQLHPPLQRNLNRPSHQGE
jgi:hypothetical protein